MPQSVSFGGPNPTNKLGGGNAPTAPMSFYDVQKQNFQNPLDVIRQGGSLTGGAPTPTTTGTALSENLSAAPDLTSLTELINTLNRNAQTQANQARIPNDPALEQQSSANIGSELSGQLPSDVLRNIQQAAAERGVGIGSPGSDNANTAMLRALGLDTLALQQQGQANLSSAVARNPAAPIFDPSKMLLTPAQKGELDYQNALLALQWYKALHPETGGGGGGNRGGMPTDPTDPAAKNNAWWNSLFPAATNPVAPLAPNLYGTTTATTPGGSSLTFTNQDFGNLFGDPYSSPGTVDTGIPPNTITGDTSSTYDPFAQYGDFLSNG